MPNHKARFDIHVNQFDGPLELLLHLIKQSKMNIYDIQIESITTQYVDYLNQMKALNIDLVGEYFVMASNLMAIKSKLLLPSLDVDEEDDDNIVDPRNELVNQLLVYQVYKQHANDLKQRYRQRTKLHSRPEVIPSYANGLMDVDHSLAVDLLRSTFQRVLDKKIVDDAPTVTVVEWQYSVEEQMTELKATLIDHNGLDLGTIFNQQPNLEALITMFLAILELVKQHQIGIEQHDQITTIKRRLGDNDGK